MQPAQATQALDTQVWPAVVQSAVVRQATQVLVAVSHLGVEPVQSPSAP